MKRIFTFAIFIFAILSLITLFFLLARNGNLQLLNPQGYIAQKQSLLLTTALMIGIFLGIPVVGFTLFIALRYREGNTKGTYSPDWVATKSLAASWWIAPAIIVICWAIIGWQSAHELDPSNTLNTSVKPVEIQVVSLQWKWLFIYPQEHIATVNFIEFPVNTPVNFHLTSDAPMNSFWIPSLGSQIYSMTGMETQLHLIANTIGEFPGESAEMSGEGFSGMNFIAKSTSNADFSNWVQTVKQSGKALNLSSYDSLAKPSSYNPQAFYNETDFNLFNKIMMKYMLPANGTNMNMTMNTI